jgi:hypothetical protein
VQESLSGIIFLLKITNGKLEMMGWDIKYKLNKYSIQYKEIYWEVDRKMLLKVWKPANEANHLPRKMTPHCQYVLAADLCNRTYWISKNRG